MSFFFVTQTGHICQKFMSTTNILVHISEAKCCSESTTALCKVAQQYGEAKLEQRIKKDWLGGQPCSKSSSFLSATSSTAQIINIVQNILWYPNQAHAILLTLQYSSLGF
jgi:hypothetical protein